jgi:diguanylate cyclase (GGDEF)-like protein
MVSETKRLLKTTALFSSCPDEDINEIAVLSGEMKMKDGEKVFDAGDPAERLYLVRSGEVVIRKDDGEGHDLDIARFLPGDYFGELDMFTGQIRNARATASGETSLFCFPGDGRRFSELSELTPAASARLFHSFLIQISARIRGINALVKENSPLVRELKRQVYVDKLTGLFNKTCFEETLARCLDGSHEHIGLLMYKPDNFKEINDTAGHEAGDKVLRFIGEALSDFVPDRDMLFRYMGNENALILPEADRTDLVRWAREIGGFLRGLDLSPILGNRDFALSVSFGLALSPDHGSDVAALVETAHPLTLEGRRKGGNCCLFPEDAEVE